VYSGHLTCRFKLDAGDADSIASFDVTSGDQIITTAMINCAQVQVSLLLVHIHFNVRIHLVFICIVFSRADDGANSQVFTDVVYIFGKLKMFYF